MSNIKYGLLSGVKGVVIALLFSLISVLIFALIIDLFNLPLSTIKPVNCILKIIAVCIGTIFAVKGDKGLVKGMLLGAIISLSAYLLFGSIGGKIDFNLTFLWELLLGVAIGGVSGIIAVAVKR